MEAINPVVWISFLVWFVAQGSKYLLTFRSATPIGFQQTGGMPSAHSAVVASMAMVIGLQEGLDSSVFGLAAIMLAIVVHDAIRLRWAVGEQALRINELINVSTLEKKEALIVWRGHRIREVAVGLLIGATLSYVLYQGFYG